MAASLADPSVFAALSVAISALLQILQLLHDFLDTSAARSPAFDAAITAVFLTLAVVSVILLGSVGILVVIFILCNDRAEAAAMAPAALLRLFTQAVTLISVLFFIFGVPLLMSFLVHTAGGRP